MITFCYVVIAVANAVSAISIARFTRFSIKSIQNIERHTKTLQVDVLLNRRNAAKARLAGQAALIDS